MAEEIGSAVYKLSLDRSAFSSGMQEAASEAETSSGRMSKAFDSLKGVLGGLAVTGLGIQGFEDLKGAIDGVTEAATKSQSIHAQTAAVLKSTGDASGFTADQIDALTSSLSRKIPVDQESLEGATNLLLTYTKIGKSTFPEATAAVANMSVAMAAAGKSMDISSIAQQVGRALQDPAKGMGALSREGIVFSTQQANVIKNLEATGHMAQAQQLIIDQLTTKFGGAGAAAAATYAGKMQILSNEMYQAKVAMGDAVLPVLTKLAEATMPLVTDLAGRLPGAISAASSALSGPFHAGLSLASSLLAGPVHEALGIGVTLFHDLTGEAQHLAGQLAGPLDAAWGFVRTNAAGLFAVLTPGLDVMITFARAIGSEGLGGALQSLPSLIAGVIRSAAGFATTLGSTIVGLFGRVDWSAVGHDIHAGLSSALGALTSLGGTAVGIGGSILSSVERDVRAVNWSAVGQTVRAGIETALHALDHIATTGINLGSQLLASINWRGVGQTLLAGIKASLDATAGFGELFINWLVTELRYFDWSSLTGVLQLAGQAILNGLLAAISSVRTVGLQIFSTIANALKSVDWGGLASSLTSAGQGILDGLLAAIAAIKTVGAQLFATIAAALQQVNWGGLAGSLVSAGQGIVSGITASLAKVDWHGLALTVVNGLGTAIEDEGGLLGKAGSLLGSLNTGGVGDVVKQLGPLSSIISAISGLLTGMGAIVSAIGAALKPIGDAFVQAFSTLLPALKPAGPLVSQLLGLFTAMKPVLEVLGGVIGGVVVGALGTVLGLVGGLVQAFADTLPAAILIVTGILQTLRGIFQLVDAEFIDTVKIIIDLIHGNWSQAWHDAVSAVTTFASGIENILGGLGKIAIGLISAPFLLIQGFIEGFVKTVIAFFQNLYDTLVGHSLIPDLVNGIISWIGQLPDKLLTLVTKAGKNIITGFTDAWTWLSTNVSTWPDKIGGWFGDLAKLLGDAASAARDAFVGPFQEMESLIADAINAVINVINGFLSGVDAALKKVGVSWQIGLINPVGASSSSGGSGTGGGVAGKATGDVLTHPQLFVAGEDAPAYPEFIIPTNPAYRGRAQGLFGALGQALGMPGFAGGGIVSGITGAVGSAASAVGNVVGSAASAVGSAALHLLSAADIPALDLSKVASNVPLINELAIGLGAKLLDAIKSLATKALSLLTGGAGGGGGAPVNLPGSVTDWLTQAIQATGVGLSWLPGLAIIAQNESGGNPSAVNNWDINAQEGHPCVPLDSLILTRRGWLRHDEVTVDDETIGYNPATGTSEWTRVSVVHHYDRAPVWRIGHRQWSARVTPNHRWWVESYGSTDAQFVEARNLGASRQRLRLAALADLPGTSDLSPHDCAVIGWLYGDGHFRKVLAKPSVCPECGWVSHRRKSNRGPVVQVENSVAVHRAKAHGMTKDRTLATDDGGWDGAIYQSKPAMIARLRALLADIPHEEAQRPARSERARPQTIFRLRRAYVTDLLRRANIEQGPEAFVLSLSPTQRAAWLGAIIDAEGHTCDHFTRIAQVDGPVQEAIRLAVYLEGHRPTYSENTARRNGYQPAGTIGMARPHVAPVMFQEPEHLEEQPVWCVTTDLGTWTMRQGTHVMLTGNSQGLMQVIPGTFAAYGPAGGNILNPVDNAIAAINYIKATYGDISNVPGVRNVDSGGSYVGYATGGVISEPITGYGLRTGARYRFGEQGPEVVSPLSGPSTGMATGGQRFYGPVNHYYYGQENEGWDALLRRAAVSAALPIG